VVGVTQNYVRRKKMNFDCIHCGEKKPASEFGVTATCWDCLDKFADAEMNNNANATVYSRARDGNVEAQLKLFVMYYNGDGVEKNIEQAIYWLTKAANQGDVTAQNELGNFYLNGNGVQKDAAQALTWYQKAAEQGYPAAQYNIGAMYYEGDGVAVDYEQAHFWFLKSAVQGDLDAENYLGLIY